MLEVEYPDMLDEIPEDRSDEVGPSWEERLSETASANLSNLFPTIFSKILAFFHDFCVGSHDAYQDRGVGTVGQWDRIWVQNSVWCSAVVV